MKKGIILLFCAITGFSWSQSNIAGQTIEEQIAAIKSLNEKGLVVAFYHSDSLNNGYKYLYEQDSLIASEVRKYENDVLHMQQNIERKYADFQKAQQQMLLSGAEMQKKEAELNHLSEKLAEFQQTNGKLLQEKALAMQQTMQIKLRAYAQLFCEKYGLDLLLMNAEGGQFTYINPTLDVTSHFVEFVNREQAKNTK